MSKRVYSLVEIEAEHEYATPHIECGPLSCTVDLMPKGRYLSPRTQNRWQAIEAWTAQLTDQNVPIVEATTDLLSEPNYPTIDQQIYLLASGVEQPLWGFSDNNRNY